MLLSTRRYHSDDHCKHLKHTPKYFDFKFNVRWLLFATECLHQYQLNEIFYITFKWLLNNSQTYLEMFQSHDRHCIACIGASIEFTEPWYAAKHTDSRYTRLLFNHMLMYLYGIVFCTLTYNTRVGVGAFAIRFTYNLHHLCVFFFFFLMYCTLYCIVVANTFSRSLGAKRSQPIWRRVNWWWVLALKLYKTYNRNAKQTRQISTSSVASCFYCRGSHRTFGTQITFSQQMIEFIAHTQKISLLYNMST